MKKLLILASFLALAYCAQSAPVDVQSAKTAAQRFVSNETTNGR